MKTLWIMCGVPGSGKTYYAKHKLINGPGWWYVSRDIVRFSLVKEDEEYFSKEKDVFDEYIRQIKKGLNEEGIFNVVADATHLNTASRKKLINAIGRKDIQIIPVVMRTDMMTSMRQNEQREGRAKVPTSVLRRMSAQFEEPAYDGIEYTAIMYVEDYRS